MTLLYLWMLFIWAAHLSWAFCFDSTVQKFIGEKNKARLEKMIMVHWTLFVFLSPLAENLGWIE